MPSGTSRSLSLLVRLSTLITRRIAYTDTDVEQGLAAGKPDSPCASDPSAVSDTVSSSIYRNKSTSGMQTKPFLSSLNNVKQLSYVVGASHGCPLSIHQRPPEYGNADPFTNRDKRRAPHSRMAEVTGLRRTPGKSPSRPSKPSSPSRTRSPNRPSRRN